MPMTPEEHERAMKEKYNKSMQTTLGGQPRVSSIVCPKHYGKECKVCDATYQYYSQRLGKEHPLRGKARELNRKLRYFSNIILPSNPTEVVLFEYGEIIYKMLFGFFNDPGSEYKGFTDPINGRNLTIKKTVPGGNKRLTDYFIEMRAMTSAIPDIGVCQKLYNLDNVVNLIESQQVKPFYQSQLPEGRTEIRILPSWLGPKFSVFYVEVPYHYISKEEFEAIQDGRVNPFGDATHPGIGVITVKQNVVPGPVVDPLQPRVNPPSDNPWGGWDPRKTTAPTPGTIPQYDIPPVTTNDPTRSYTTVDASAVVDPVCMGGYSVNSPLCTSRCAPTAMEKCKVQAATTNQPSDADQKAIRETAARLYK